VRIAEPGMGYIPDGCRVVNVGSGGQTINDAVSERDAANTFTQFTLAGGAANNKILFHMGTNDMGAIGGTQTAAAVYAEVVALLNSASPSGYLQKGWKVYVANNTAADDSTKAVQIPALRALYNDPQFLTDTLSNTGQTYDGLVKVIQTQLITKSPDGTIFDTQADAQSLVYYKDGLHPSEAGNDVLVSGGDTPQYGFGAGISL
jgi:lysophospholipase L1-like esterase